MTDREVFEKWWTDNCKRVVNDYGFDTFQEDCMYTAWQAATLAERERCALIAERHMVIGSIANKIRGE